MRLRDWLHKSRDRCRMALILVHNNKNRWRAATKLNFINRIIGKRNFQIYTVLNRNLFSISSLLKYLQIV